jgi:hypothetical protein
LKVIWQCLYFLADYNFQTPIIVGLKEKRSHRHHIFNKLKTHRLHWLKVCVCVFIWTTCARSRMWTHSCPDSFFWRPKTSIHGMFILVMWDLRMTCEALWYSRQICQLTLMELLPEYFSQCTASHSRGNHLNNFVLSVNPFS